MSFSDNRNMLLFNESGMFFMDDWLMMLVDVLLINDRLCVLMDDVLVMLVDDVPLVFNKHIFVMLMDDILMDFFHKRSHGVGLMDISAFLSQNLLSFIDGFHDRLFVMLNYNRFLVDLLNMGLSSAH